jgi:hypothetical protein
VAAAPGGDAVAATTVLATTTVAEALGRLMVDGVARGVEHVRSSLLLSVGEIAISAALRTLDAALAFRAMASHGGRQELLLEQFESQRRRPRGAPPPPALATSKSTANRDASRSSKPRLTGSLISLWPRNQPRPTSRFAV